MAAKPDHERVTKELIPYHTTVYKNFFILRVSIRFNETRGRVERRGGRELVLRRQHSYLSPEMSSAVESCQV